jgi:predicted transcriptional regulator
MIQQVLNNKGGLHNRVTRRMRLLPFTVGETAAYLQQRRIKLDHYQLLGLYMAMGGIPQYLREITTGESSTQAINRICFTKDGFLNKEFPNLFHSLFDEASNHMSIVKALAKKGKGLTRTEIISECNISSGGGATQILEELTESGFITPYIPFDRTVKDSIYKLTDEYSLFYLRFIDGKKIAGAKAWERVAGSALWKTWSGYAFESICLKHMSQIKSALGIASVYSEASVWRHQGTGYSTGAQIDLLIDRDDRCINLCEIKFANAEFVIDKKYSGELDNKVNVFREQTNTKKTVFATMITTYGVKKNDHYTGRIQAEVKMEALFG